MHYAAIGTDGLRPVVWGLGDTEEAAYEDGCDQLRECDLDEPLTVVSITPEQRERIEQGDVDANGLVRER